MALFALPLPCPAVLAAKQAGEASVQAQQKALAEAEGRLQQIETAVCDLILTVAGLPAK